MSHRTLKRVPLDFRWPIDRVWKGYINPYRSEKCASCDGSGASPEGKFLSDSWYRFIAEGMFGNYFGSNLLAIPGPERLKQMGWDETVIRNIALARKFGFKILAHWDDKLDQEDVQALVDAGRLCDFTHTFIRGEGWVKREPAVVPTAGEVNAWSGRGFGHDCINQGVCINGRCKRLNIDPWCQACGGDGQEWPDPEIKKKHEAWKREEPPQGDGWQLWETVSEGSPISLVYKTAGELAQWCADTGAMGPGSKLSKEQCLRLLRDVEKLEVGSMMVGVSGKGLRLLAEEELGEPSPKDWTPEPK